MYEGVSRQQCSDLRWKNQQIMQRQMLFSRSLLSLSLALSLSLFLSYVLSFLSRARLLALSLSRQEALLRERGDRLVTEPFSFPSKD